MSKAQVLKKVYYITDKFDASADVDGPNDGGDEFDDDDPGIKAEWKRQTSGNAN